MFKPRPYIIILYILIKYFAFYIFMMFKNQNFTLVSPGIRNGEDLFFYLWLFLFFPIVTILLFSGLIYLAFKRQEIVLFSVVIIGYLIGEYFLYTYLASTSDLSNGIYNGVLSISVLYLFFFNRVNSILMQQPVKS
jgi:hypothetical protein